MSRITTPRARLELVLVLSTLVLGGVAVRRWQHALATPAFARGTTAAAAAEPVPFDGDSLAAAANATIDNDPFRLANEPADVRFEPRRVGAPPPAPAAPKIVLVLKAIVGGPPWQAMIDGIPGHQGAVVRSGDTFDKLVIRRVTRDTVVVQGPDTTWKLTIKRD
jgi:hypothetical protein